MNKILTAFATLILYTSTASADDHVHGGDIPTWYDPACCSQRDCKPVEDSEIEFGLDLQGNAYAIYKPTGHTFYKYQFKLSQDERYHVCINPAAGKNGALCFYDRGGA